MKGDLSGKKNILNSTHSGYSFQHWHPRGGPSSRWRRPTCWRGRVSFEAGNHLAESKPRLKRLATAAATLKGEHHNLNQKLDLIYLDQVRIWTLGVGRLGRRPSFLALALAGSRTGWARLGWGWPCFSLAPCTGAAEPESLQARHPPTAARRTQVFDKELFKIQC